MTKPKENKDKEPEEKTQSDKDITDRIKNGEIEPRLVVEPLSFKLDERNIVYLTSSGQFYLSRFQGTDNDTKEEKWSEDLKFSAPLSNLSLIKQGENWKIRYTFDNEIRQDSIDTMLSFLANKIKLDTGSSKLFAQFLYKFKTDKEKNKEFEIFYEPVAVVDGVIKINRISDQSTKEILQTLIDIHKISTFPDSFLISLDYALLVPFSYEIRMTGQKFPFRLSAGKTHGGKTSDQTLLILMGFDQKIKERKESLNTIKTIFTFGQQVERSRLPFLTDDINNEWLKNHSEELKGSTDSVKFMARGTKAQTQNTWDMVGMPIFTMNQEPTVPLALTDRIIMSHYTEENSKRQNKKEFERLVDLLKPGFMFNLIKETMEGARISEIVQQIHKSVKTDEEINQKLIDYTHSLITDLCKKYDLEFPEIPKIDVENKGFDLLETFCTYVATRLSGNDRDGTTYQKFSVRKAKKDDETDEIRITGPGYSDFVRDSRLKGMDTMTDFWNEMKNPQIKLDNKYIPSLKSTARCIIMPLKLIRDEIKENVLTEEQYKELLE